MMTARALTLAALLFASLHGTSMAAETEGPQLVERRTINLAAARVIVSAAEAEARARNVRVSIVVVDDRGAVLMSVRQDGAAPSSIDLAVAKARTSAAGGVETRVYADAYRAGETEIATLAGQIPLPGGVTLYPGGVPLKSKTWLVGGIGVSGAAPDTDEMIARAGAAKVPGHQ